MARILIAEDSPTQAQQLQYLLEEAGHEAEVAANGQEALLAIRHQSPDAVITDLEMPVMNGLALVENIRRLHPAVPVILMTAFGSEEIAALALQKGAASYVPKRYFKEDLLQTLEKLLPVAQAERQRQQVLAILAGTESRFVLQNDPALIPPLIGYLEDLIKQMTLCDPNGLIRIGVALREALTNAMDHGNMEASSELRQNDDQVYYHLLAERRRQPPYRDRRVYVTARITRPKAEFVIRDEGPGFDVSQLPDPTDPANLERVGNRGLLLIRTFMDEVKHNPSGNEITMVKHCDRDSQA
jgi:CheY-like chemotaxis protein/anti-sigma regulatory factor (Ser/Thr protein kinase)